MVTVRELSDPRVISNVHGNPLQLERNSHTVKIGELKHLNRSCSTPIIPRIHSEKMNMEPKVGPRALLLCIDPG